MHLETGLELSSGVRPKRLDRIDGLWRPPDEPEKFVANNTSFSKSIAEDALTFLVYLESTQRE